MLYIRSLIQSYSNMICSQSICTSPLLPPKERRTTQSVSTSIWRSWLGWSVNAVRDWGFQVLFSRSKSHCSSLLASPVPNTRYTIRQLSCSSEPLECSESCDRSALLSGQERSKSRSPVSDGYIASARRRRLYTVCKTPGNAKLQI